MGEFDYLLENTPQSDGGFDYLKFDEQGNDLTATKPKKKSTWDRAKQFIGDFLREGLASSGEMLGQAWENAKAYYSHRFVSPFESTPMPSIESEVQQIKRGIGMLKPLLATFSAPFTLPEAIVSSLGAMSNRPRERFAGLPPQGYEPVPAFWKTMTWQYSPTPELRIALEPLAGEKPTGLQKLSRSTRDVLAITPEALYNILLVAPTLFKGGKALAEAVIPKRIKVGEAKGILGNKPIYETHPLWDPIFDFGKEKMRAKSQISFVPYDSVFPGVKPLRSSVLPLEAYANAKRIVTEIRRPTFEEFARGVTKASESIPIEQAIKTAAGAVKETSTPLKTVLEKTAKATEPLYKTSKFGEAVILRKAAKPLQSLFIPSKKQEKLLDRYIAIKDKPAWKLTAQDKLFLQKHKDLESAYQERLAKAKQIEIPEVKKPKSEFVFQEEAPPEPIKMTAKGNAVFKQEDISSYLGRLEEGRKKDFYAYKGKVYVTPKGQKKLEKMRLKAVKLHAGVNLGDMASGTMKFFGRVGLTAEELSKTPKFVRVTPQVDAFVKHASEFIEPVLGDTVRKMGFKDVEEWVHKTLLHGIAPKDARRLIQNALALSKKDVLEYAPFIETLFKKGTISDKDVKAGASKFKQSIFSVFRKDISPEEAMNIAFILDTDPKVKLLPEEKEAELGGNLTGRQWYALDKFAEKSNLHPDVPIHEALSKPSEYPKVPIDLPEEEIEDLIKAGILERINPEVGKKLKAPRLRITKKGLKIYEAILTSPTSAFRRANTYEEFVQNLKGVMPELPNEEVLRKAWQVRKILREQAEKLVERGGFSKAELIRHWEAYFPHKLQMHLARKEMAKLLDDETVPEKDKTIIRALLKGGKEFANLVDQKAQDLRSTYLISPPTPDGKILPIDVRRMLSGLGVLNPERRLSEANYNKVLQQAKELQMLYAVQSRLSRTPFQVPSPPILPKRLITRKNLPSWFNKVWRLSFNAPEVILDVLEESARNIRMLDALEQIAKDPDLVLTENKARELAGKYGAPIKDKQGNIKYSVLVDDKGHAYVRIPNNPQRWGALSGKFVLRDLKEYIDDLLDHKVNPSAFYRFIDALGSMTHAMLTVFNIPWYHIRNTLTSVFMSYPLVGVEGLARMSADAKRVYELLAKNKPLDEWIEKGIVGREQLEGISQIRGITAQDPLEKARAFAKAVANSPAEFANIQDAVARVTLYEELKRQYKKANVGVGDDDIKEAAAQVSRDTIPAYDETAKALSFINKIFPFISWGMKATKYPQRVIKSGLGIGGFEKIPKSMRGAGIGGSEGKLAFAKWLLLSSILPTVATVSTIKKLKEQKREGKRKLKQAYKNIPPWEKNFIDKFVSKTDMPDDMKTVWHFLSESFTNGKVYILNKDGEIQEINLITQHLFSPAQLLKDRGSIPLGFKLFYDINKQLETNSRRRHPLPVPVVIAETLATQSPVAKKIMRKYRINITKGMDKVHALTDAFGYALDPRWIEDLTGKGSYRYKSKIYRRALKKYRRLQRRKKRRKKKNKADFWSMWEKIKGK